MKLNRFDMGGLTALVGYLVFMSASMTQDLVVLTQTWKNITFWTGMFGAIVFYIGVGIFYSVPIHSRK